MLLLMVPPSKILRGRNGLPLIPPNDCVITDCYTMDYPTGGIWSSGDLTLTDCVIGNCGANYDGGYGIACDGNLILTGCIITNCEGGIRCGAATLRRCTISHNTAHESSGGGIQSSGPLIIDECVINNNIAIAISCNGAVGGGIEVGSGGLLMANSTISGNMAYQFLDSAATNQNIRLYQLR